MAEILRGYGVTHVFHVPTAFFATLAALEGTGVQRVLTHGEKAAAYMADGFARASGRPGVCLAQAIGSANLAAGLADALMAGSPVIAMTTAVSEVHRYRHAYQEFDHAESFRAVTKSRYAVAEVSRLGDLLPQAFRDATSGSPGPVHLHIADAAADAEAELSLVIEPACKKVPAFRPAPDSESLDEAAYLLCRASQPVIVAGGGSVSSEAWRELQELAERLTIPVATSSSAKGVFSNRHPLWAGVVGRYSHWWANRLVSAADLVIFVGTRAGGLTTWDWQLPPLDTPTIQINIDPGELGRNYPALVSLHGDARETLRAILQRIPKAQPNDERISLVHELRRRWADEIEGLARSDMQPIRPERLCRELSEAMPEGALLMSDTGHAAIWSGTMIDIPEPGRTYIRCSGSLGWGLPASIGAKAAAPDRLVICFTGDGGFWYHIGEIETAVRHGISPVIVVNDNHSLNQEMWPVWRAYGPKPWGAYRELMDFRKVDLARVAKEMGAYGERVERPGDIRAALERAFAAERIAVLDVVTDPDALAPTPRPLDVRPSAKLPYDALPQA